MYSTTGIDAIATITELRSKTSELLEHVREKKSSILIQKNNEAYAVLIDWETYLTLVNEGGEGREAEDRPSRRRGRKKTGGEETARSSR
jgi:prevent-host-death family protein